MIGQRNELLHTVFVNSDVESLLKLFNVVEVIPTPFLSILWRGGSGRVRSSARRSERRVAPNRTQKSDNILPSFGLGVGRRKNSRVDKKPPTHIHRFSLSGEAGRRRKAGKMAEKKHRRNARRWR